MFRIDQTGLSQGVINVSRTDGLSTGATITITYVGTGTFRPRLLWVPIGDTTAISSLAQSSPGVWTCAPTVNAYGTYRIEGIENEGKPNERRIVRLLRVRTPTGLAIPAFGERANFLATSVNASQTHIDQSEDNAVDYSSSELNAVPWTGSFRTWQEAMIAATNGQVGTLTVDAVMNALPSATTGGRVLPTSAYNLDGVIPVAGQRYLYPYGTVANGGGIWQHNGTILVRPSDEPGNVAGKTILVKKGERYRGALMACNPDVTAINAYEPVWRAAGRPLYYASQGTAASGSVIAWPSMLTFRLPIALNTISHVRIRGETRKLSSPPSPARVIETSAVYYGNNSDAVPASEPLRLTDPGELETESRFQILPLGNGQLRICILNDAAGGNNYMHEVQVFVESMFEVAL